MSQNQPANSRSITGDILLEAGTNEVEILVFCLGERNFGVNVAKVREVIRNQPTKDVPHKHDSVVGMFEIRGSVLTLIDLGFHLGVNATVNPASKNVADDDDRSIIVTEFNGVQIGFLIDGVDRIHRLSWSEVLSMPSLSLGEARSANEHSMTTGVIDIEGTLVLLVDFESVADSILAEKKLAVTDVANELEVDRAGKRVIIAEDSPYMRGLIRRTMVASGYTNVEVYEDGQAAWEAVQADGPPIDAIVSDIEMPRMDGLHFVKRVRENARHANVPIVLFSSLVSEDNEKKGRAVGANVQIQKPELEGVVRLVDRVIRGDSLDDIENALGLKDKEEKAA